jgi:hypothetical protein
VAGPRFRGHAQEWSGGSIMPTSRTSLTTPINRVSQAEAMMVDSVFCPSGELDEIAINTNVANR